MSTMTVKELRERARELGITNYSKLRKSDLLSAIAEAEARTQASAEVAPEQPQAPEPARTANDREQHIEQMKYATGVAEHAYAPDLGEDINTLPPLRGEPRIVLLAQKPGVLHVYWHLAPGQLANRPGMRLRLGLVHDQQFHVREEVPLSSERGSWYFHVDESWHPATIYVQLGTYDANGQFVIAIRRGIVRLPRLLELSTLGINWALTAEEFERRRATAGAPGALAAGRWPQGPSSYEFISSHVVSSSASARRS